MASRDSGGGRYPIPYFAVVMANGGREPASTKRFQAYEPRLPERYGLPASGRWPAGSPGTDEAPGAAPRPGGHIRESGAGKAAGKRLNGTA